jgi:hypothetical protein
VKTEKTNRQRIEAARELLEGTSFEVSFTAKDREHNIQMSASEVRKLQEWLKRPSGSFGTGDVSFDAVQGGGILVRTQPYAVRQARQAARAALANRYCKESPTEEHNSVQAINGDTNEPLGYRLCGYCGRREWK